MISFDTHEHHNVPTPYSRYLRGTLKEVLEHQTFQQQQYDLNAEIALLRDIAGRMAAMYEEAVANGKAEQVVGTASMLTEALNEVGDMIQRAASIEASLSKAHSFTPMAVAGMLNRVVETLYDELGDNDHFDVMRLEEALRNRLLETKLGTDITPDQDVIDMDETIPHAEEVS